VSNAPARAASTPGCRPLALRYTFISLLLANGAELPYVMVQVGHADESTTLRIYAKVLRRNRRYVGQAVDEMVGGAIPVATDGQN
jgi:integrase